MMPNEHVEELKDWLKGTGSHFLVLNTEEHDYVTGIVSHFPHLIARFSEASRETCRR